MANAAFQIQVDGGGYGAVGAHAVASSGSVINCKLDSITGVTSITWEFHGSHDDGAVFPAITLSGTPHGQVATFTLPAGTGQAWGITCKVNGGAQASQHAERTARSAIYVPFDHGDLNRLPAFINETFERNSTHGVTEAFNAVLALTEGSGGDALLVVDNIADLRATPSNDLMAAGLVVTLGALTKGDGGHGIWRPDLTSGATDDTGTVIKPTDETGSRRLLRLWDGQNLQLKWFGGPHDGVGDDTPAFLLAIQTWANASDPVLWFPGQTRLDIDTPFTEFTGQAIGGSFKGDDRRRTVVTLVTDSGVRWFASTTAATKLVSITWQDIEFTCTNKANGRGFLNTGPNQDWAFDRCRFSNMHDVHRTEGALLASETRFVGCRFSSISGYVLTLDNQQSVMHRFFGCDAVTITGGILKTDADGGGQVYWYGGSLIMSGSSNVVELDSDPGTFGANNGIIVFDRVHVELTGDSSKLFTQTKNEISGFTSFRHSTVIASGASREIISMKREHELEFFACSVNLGSSYTSMIDTSSASAGSVGVTDLNGGIAFRGPCVLEQTVHEGLLRTGTWAGYHIAQEVKGAPAFSDVWKDRVDAATGFTVARMIVAYGWDSLGAIGHFGQRTQEYTIELYSFNSAPAAGISSATGVVLPPNCEVIECEFYIESQGASSAAYGIGVFKGDNAVDPMIVADEGQTQDSIRLYFRGGNGEWDVGSSHAERALIIATTADGGAQPTRKIKGKVKYRRSSI